jgi:hypothetical protein
LEIQSFAGNAKKKELEVEKIYWLIKRGIMRVSGKEFVELSGLYYCWKEIGRIQYYSYAKMVMKVLQRMMPDEYCAIFESEEAFRKEIGGVIEREKNNLMSKKSSLLEIYGKVIEIVSQKVEYMTYFIEV